jgi:hypothetical protein
VHTNWIHLMCNILWSLLDLQQWVDDIMLTLKRLWTWVQCISKSVVWLLPQWQNVCVNISANKIEELIFYSDSGVQFMSHHSDLGSIHDLPEDSDNGVVTNAVWHDSASENYSASIHGFRSWIELCCCTSHQCRIFIIWLFSTNVHRWIIQHCFGKRQTTTTNSTFKDKSTKLSNQL